MKLETGLGTGEPDFLERAAAIVIQRCAADPLAAPDEALLRQALGEVTEGIRDALVGSEPAFPTHVPVDGRRLLRSLRGVVLEDWCDEEGSLLEIMRAFEATERALGGDHENVSASPFSRSLLREVVHLLRSPLASVVMLAGRLREERVGPLNEAQHRQLDIIHRAATSAASTCSDLLTLTRREEDDEEARRFSVSEMVERVADVVRPVAEARGSGLVVRAQVPGPRRGPANGLAQALLGLAVRLALATREGTVELAVQGVEGDFVSFALTGQGGSGASGPEADPFLIFRTGPGIEGFTLSAEALSFATGRQILQALGTDLEVATTDDGALTLRFTMSLPTAV